MTDFASNLHWFHCVGLTIQLDMCNYESHYLEVIPALAGRPG